MEGHINVKEQLFRQARNVIERVTIKREIFFGNKRGIALGLKARLALLIKDHRTAATATKAIIDFPTAVSTSSGDILHGQKTGCCLEQSQNNCLLAAVLLQ